MALRGKNSMSDVCSLGSRVLETRFLPRTRVLKTRDAIFHFVLKLGN